jgi:hypothetical protein
MWQLKQWLQSIFLGVLVGIIVLTAVLLLPFVLAGSWLWGRWLQARYRAKWSKQGKPILFVYSNSPNWQRYIEEHWLPQLRSHAVVLNWSERKAWPRQRPFEARVFDYFAESEEFNPIALYFPRQGQMRTVRFWQAFRDFKHGREQKLKEAERELFDILAQIGQENV